MIRQHHHIKSTIALAAALTATLAPAAWADPAPLARAEATIAANTQSNTAVRPNPDRQAVTGATDPEPCSEVCSSGAASYGSTSNPSPCSEVCSSGAASYRSGTQRSWMPDSSGATLPHSGRPRPSARSETQTLSPADIQRGAVQTGLQHLASPASAPPAAVHVVTHDGRFHWGDAGIGAGSMLAVVLIGIGGAVTLTHRRRVHDAHAS